MVALVLTEEMMRVRRGWEARSARDWAWMVPRESRRVPEDDSRGANAASSQMAAVCGAMRGSGDWGEETDLDDLCETVCKLAFWKGCEEGDVDKDIFWLPESADEI